MRIQELEQQTADAVAPVVKQTMILLSAYEAQEVSPRLWESLMVLLYEVVEKASIAVAELARRFYDEERERAFPGIPRNDVFRAELSFEQFSDDMSEVYKLFRKKESTPENVHRAALRVARSIENTARWTMIKAIESPDPYLDDDDLFVESEEGLIVESLTKEESLALKNKMYKAYGGRRWARVATGAETCGWCLMLCSRGPVYASEARGGGLNAWHDGCDCKVVPVFDLEDWEGRERYLASLEMWKGETNGYRGKEAIAAMTKAASDGKFQKYLKQVS